MTNDAPSLLATTRASIAKALARSGRPDDGCALIAVSKTFGPDRIRPVLESGQRVFGENRVQEAKSKWPLLRENFPDAQVHLIGPLQSNKAGEAVALFDAIHTVDRDKIARALAREIAKQDRRPKLFVQVNTGEEPQKAGIVPREAADFVARCRSEHGLDITGLMCIPPVEDNPGPHFALLAKLADELALADLSMGMSADYETAIELGATDVLSLIHI